jgi:hypothetical protein
MQITCQAERPMRCSAAAAFALLTDHQRFPLVFTGYGPIAALRSVSLDAPLAVGATRRVHGADGSTLTETITALDPPRHHAYVLSGFRPPFSWLVRRGEADWLVTAGSATTFVRWDYVFTLTSAVIYPLAAPLLRVFMTGAMRRCLDNMARLLEAQAASVAVTRVS